MAFCIRVIVTILLLVFTAAGTCSLLFPLFRKESGDKKAAVYFWYWESGIKTKVGDSEFRTIVRVNSRDLSCDKSKNFYLASSALAVAGTGLGGIATLISIGYLFVRRSCCMALSIVILAFLAFACFTADVGMIASTYTQDACENEVLDVFSFNSFKSQDFDIVEGFGLMCAAAGGFLIIFFLAFCA